MEETNEYWKVMDYPPVFTSIDWNDSQDINQSQFIPMEYDEQKGYNHQPFPRRRSSSVDLPVNPAYFHTNKHIIHESTIQEEEFLPRRNRIGSSATLEFPGYIISDSPSSSVSSSDNHSLSPLKQEYHPQQQQQQQQKQKQQQQQTITLFPELHRTSYNTILGNQLKQHQKRRRSSSLPPAFLKQRQHQQQQHVPTPLIFTTIQVTDPTPVHHIQKAAKVDTRPVQIERVHKPVAKPVTCDPVETQKKLDEDLVQLNFEDVTVAELKEMLRERGLPATGKKAVLTERLRDARDQLLKNKSSGGTATTWLKADSVSPHLQGLANMTIHSPIPPNEQLFGPVDDLPSNNTNTTLFPTLNTQTDDNEIDINDIFNFDPNDTILDDNAILFPPTWDHDDLVINSTEWDQDKLDLFLTELV
ncbi:hypothetical protein EDC94DRAFT_655073 [Helicostylum pulchrum]|nr:hypothetical protein EDC94DRAFT_655073 [Helicostylum pulchrum]